MDFYYNLLFQDTPKKRPHTTARTPDRPHRAGLPQNPTYRQTRKGLEATGIDSSPLCLPSPPPLLTRDYGYGAESLHALFGYVSKYSILFYDAFFPAMR